MFLDISFLRVVEFSFNIQGKVLKVFSLQKNHLNLLSHLKRIPSIASNYLLRNEVLNAHTKLIAMTKSNNETTYLQNHLKLFFLGKFKIGEIKRIPMVIPLRIRNFKIQFCKAN